jgi:molybdate transport system permease protein
MDLFAPGRTDADRETERLRQAPELPAARQAAQDWRAQRTQRWALPLASIPLLVFLALPLLALFLRLDIGALGTNLAAPIVRQALVLSLVTATIATVSAVLLGAPLAMLLARRQFRGHNLLDTLVDLPMILPPAVAGIALLLVFGRRGLLGPSLEAAGLSIVFTPVAVVLAQLFVAAPFFVRSAAAGFAEIDRELEQAAALDGAGRLDVFRYITAALAWPALVGGAVMTWARAVGEFGATIIFAGNFPGRTQTMPLAIYLGFERDLDIAVALAFVLTAVSFGVLVLVKWLLSLRMNM